MKPNYEAEQAVIGALFLDSKKTMPLAAMHLSSDDFLVPEFHTAYSVCEELYKAGTAIDFVTVMSHLTPEYRQVLLEASQSVPTLSHTAEYIQQVRERSEKQEAYTKAANMLSGIDESTPVDDCRKMAAEITKSFVDRSDSKASSAAELFIDFTHRADHQGEQHHISSGFKKLDDYIFMDKGDYVVVGGRPSAGKTAFTLQLMLHMANPKKNDRPYKVGYFSLETGKKTVADRLISNYARISYNAIQTGKMDDEDFIAMTESGDSFMKLQFEVIPAAGWSVEKVRSETIVKGYDIIFIDYLQLLKSYGKDRVEKATNISIDLHTMAQADNVLIVALSQLNRAGAADPKMTDLRESGQIEQDADAIMLLNYDDKQPDKRDLCIVKNKKGRIGKIPFSFNGDFQRFTWIDAKAGEPNGKQIA
ncbi:MAG: hypothetical protein E7572_05230 [Ruminococcaceae bacterium]|nr:hypothetical protein [Oscillospiraceae bacterium]